MRTLRSPDESYPFLKDLFGDVSAESLRLEVREDRCFKEGRWLPVGEIRLFPPGPDAEEEDALSIAGRIGAYTWSVPDVGTLTKSAESVLIPSEKSSNAKGSSKEGQQDRKLGGDDKLNRALEAIGHCASRCGFVNPVFDAASIVEMPFTRPTTVVADTNAVLQGALDFVVRFLYPMARIKIPAIVHMEILTIAERYFSLRRAKKINSAAKVLMEHVKSQAGQRVLLRLELHTDTEIERPRLGADPLRGIVQPDGDGEDSSLNLQVVPRGFADRLILETAIQHRAGLSPDHSIAVLTADQGLAKMAMAEGMDALYFLNPRASAVYGATLPGTCFKPFVDEEDGKAYFHIPMMSLVWEMAATFGAARLVSASGRKAFTVVAMGEDVHWFPFHSHDDLLWTSLDELSNDDGQGGGGADDDGPTDNGPEGKNPNEAGAGDDGKETARKVKDKSQTGNRSADASQTEKPTAQSPSKDTPVLTGSYRFALQSMMNLIWHFTKRDAVSDKEGMKVVGLETPGRYADLRNFLIAGGFAHRVDGGLEKLPPMDDIIHAVRAVDVQGLGRLLKRVPSFRAFLEELAPFKAHDPSALRTIGQSAVATYVNLGEVVGRAMHIPKEGIYATLQAPPLKEFAQIALSAYKSLRRDGELVLVGSWLEELVRRYAIHPLDARQRLEEAAQANLIERYTEGSTPETQFEKHNMVLLELVRGVPMVTRLNLYHGDFLIAGRASVSLRLKEVTT